MKIQPISYSKIAAAIDYYQSKGWQYVEVPWIVSPSVHRATVPFGENDPRYYDNKLPDGFLVGSAEQGFVQLAESGALKPGKYCAVSPCFRSEAEKDDIHYRNFMKVELFQNWRDQYLAEEEKDLEQMITEVIGFMSKYLTVVKKVFRPLYDIDIQEVTTGIELGSYGMRSIGNIEYLCGTALAEPRFSTVSEHVALCASDSLTREHVCGNK